MEKALKVLNVEKKKGDPDNLDGQVTVYAKIDMDVEELMTISHPVASMVHGGLIAVQGNYREQGSLRDFLRNEMGISLDGNGIDDGLEEMIDGLDGLESALDPQKLRERLEALDDIEEFIPTPAKVVPFHTEHEILSQPGDVYFAGFYKKIGNAVLGINAVPIIYQALFREQQMKSLQSEIDSIISQLECGDPDYTVTSPEINPEELLIREYFPSMLYHRVDTASFATAQKQFRAFMRGYRFNDDIDAIISLITENIDSSGLEYRLLELYAKKIALVIAEDFLHAETVKKEIETTMREYRAEK
ncbi:MAG: hypothetical protein LBU70_06145 [Chitinispirillales bacterium]|jgi:hypothetical protein|nr:hypothetical protein [Chitinispirillales bacterium]